jgi:hypothetical protein
MRLVDPDSAKVKFPQIGDLIPPEQEKKPEEDPEAPPVDPPQRPVFPEPQPFPWLEPGGGGGGGGIEYTAGDYIEVDNRKREIKLKHKDFEPGRHCIFTDDGFVRGIEFTVRETSTEEDGDQFNDNHIVMNWNEVQPDKTILEFGLKNLKTLMVVTDVQFYPSGVPGESGTDPVFRVTKKPVLVWLNGDEQTYDIPLAVCDESPSGSSKGPGEEEQKRQAEATQMPFMVPQ